MKQHSKQQSITAPVTELLMQLDNSTASGFIFIYLHLLYQKWKFRNEKSTNNAAGFEPSGVLLHPIKQPVKMLRIFKAKVIRYLTKKGN
jgi:hypothetical protein